MTSGGLGLWAPMQASRPAIAMSLGDEKRMPLAEVYAADDVCARALPIEVSDTDVNELVRVAERGLNVDVLEEVLEHGVLDATGVESTSRIVDSLDDGCVWTETAEAVTVDLTLQGLRGQPAAALAVHLQSSRDEQYRGRGTATVTAFGRIMWSCVMRGAIVVDACSVEAEDGPGMLPVMRVTVRKLPGASRWDGFIDEVEFNTLM